MWQSKEMTNFAPGFAHPGKRVWPFHHYHTGEPNLEKSTQKPEEKNISKTHTNENRNLLFRQQRHRSGVF